jgi:SAM-dependent methyltransferase
MAYAKFPPARWPFSLPVDTHPNTIRQMVLEVDRLTAASQYGWGHTIDFGPFRKDGLLGYDYLEIAGALDQRAWWAPRLDSLRVADIGCFTGGLSLLMAHRGADVVYAVDEIPEHLEQCAFLASTFHAKAVQPVLKSVYRLGEVVEPGSLDLILFAGVLYHLSDMLIGLYALRTLLKPGGVLLIQGSAIDDFQHSYANFGRFFAGTWWQPTGLCIQDMCHHMGYSNVEAEFYDHNLCIARAVRSNVEIPFRRGLNWTFEDIRDRRARTLDWSIMAPVPTDTALRRRRTLREIFNAARQRFANRSRK